MFIERYYEDFRPFKDVTFVDLPELQFLQTLSLKGHVGFLILVL